MIAAVLVTAAAVVVVGHELWLFVRARRASFLLQNKTWPARQDRRATDQHR